MIDPREHPKHLITDPGLPTFLALSAVLTGYTEAELQRTGMLEDHYMVLMKEQDQEGVRRFFLEAQKILSQGGNVEKQFKKAFIDLPPGVTGPDTPFDQMSHCGLGPRIILLWYSGAWTTMNDLKTKSQRDRTTIPSARAYREGLIWTTACTHPAGAKQQGFGSWSVPPLP